MDDHQTQSASPPAAPTFGAFLQEFQESFGGWSQTTWRGATGIVRAYEAVFGAIPLRELTPRQIDAYLMRRRREGLTEATCNRYLAALKTMLKTARIWGYIDESPADRLTMLKEQNRVPSSLTDAEVERLLSCCSEAIRPVVMLAVDTGMRRSELGRLAWRDVDLEDGMLTVRRSKNRDYRVIPMTSRVRELLHKLRQAAEDRETVLPTANISRPLSRAAKEAGVGHVHTHMLRHAFATRLRDRGVPLDRIMELMGHRSYQVVLRYAKARPQQLFEAMRTLDGDPNARPADGTGNSDDHGGLPAGARPGSGVVRMPTHPDRP